MPEGRNLAALLELYSYQDLLIKDLGIGGGEQT